MLLDLGAAPTGPAFARAPRGAFIVTDKQAGRLAPRDFTAREQAEEDAVPLQLRAAYEAPATHDMAGSAA